MRGFWQDLRYTARSLRRNPGFGVTTTLTLALGIGATTTVFTVTNAVLLRPLPFPDPERIVRIASLSEEGEEWTVSPPDFTDWRRENTSFEVMAAFHPSSATLTGGGGAERVEGVRVTPGFFQVLGVAPALGRGILPENEQPGHDQVIVLSHGLWQRRFGSDPEIIGRTIEVDGELYTVVGIMPRGFDFPQDAEVWRPRSFSTEDLTTQRGAHYLSVIGRLQPGASLDRATAEMRSLAAAIATAYPATNTGLSASVVRLHEALVRDDRPALLILMGAVGLVLLIACVNAANLSLARSLGRERELAIRKALGADRRRIMRAVLSESLVTAALAGVLGVLLSFWGVELLISLRGDEVARIREAHIDGAALGFALAVTVVTGVVFGIVTALREAFGRQVHRVLRGAGPGQLATTTGSRIRGGLIVAEIALAVVLLAGAGLLLRSFLKLQRVDPGFRTSRVLSFNLSLPEARYPEPRQARAFFAEVVERIESLPGVEGAGAIFGLPLSGFSYVISVELLDSAPAYDAPGEEKSVQVRVVTPDFFRVMDIPLLRGRLLSQEDREHAPGAVLVDETAARLLWPGEDPLGRTVELGTRLGLGGERVGGTVVGVVADIHDEAPGIAPRPHVYAAHAQFPTDFMSVVVRTAGDPSALIGPIREEVRRLDADLPMYEVRTTTELLLATLAGSRFHALLVGAFAVAALLLAGVGLYGLTAYMVGQRKREIGIRMAVGAQPSEVLQLMLGYGLALAAAGLLLGLGGALALTRFLRSLLYDLSPTDATTLLVVIVVLGGTALLATYLPARRATRVDPMIALRVE